MQLRSFIVLATRRLDRLGRRPLASLILIALVSLVGSVAPALMWGLPLPGVHDEFAYLLAGDTFAHGRLTNPPHKLAEFFDTFHTIQSPTYMAKFPVGQGLSLALGILLGLPILGVWLTLAIACAATSWMLRAVMPARWSLLGGLLVSLHPMTSWWSQSYLGGAVAMLGGALLSAAALRLAKAPRPAWGSLLGISLAILANSRPLEGLITSIVVLSWLALRAPAHLARAIAPAALILLPTFAFMAYYNWRVTGSALTLPYTLHQKQYMVAPLFYYQQPAASVPLYSSKELADFYTGLELNEYRRQIGSFDHAPAMGAIAEKAYIIYHDYVGLMPLSIVPLAISLWCARRNRAARLAWAACLLLPGAHLLITPWFRPAYLAPVYPFLVLLLTQGLRQMSRWRIRQWPIGAAAALAIGALLVGFWPRWARAFNRDARPVPAVSRAAVLSELEAQEGKHLVLMRYGPRHSPLFEWVFNDSDIDQSKVIFARSMGDAKDRELIEYFKDRKVWPIDFDENREPRVRRFNPGEWP